MENNFAKEKTKRLIPCRGIKYQPLISLEQCKKCLFFIEIKLIKPAQNNMPPVETIICGLPTSVRISYFIEDDVPAKGKKPAIFNSKEHPIKLGGV